MVQKPAKQIFVCLLINLFFSLNAFSQLNNTVLDSTILADMKKAAAPGAAMAVVFNGRVVYQKSFGVANVFKETPIDAGNSIFHISSITKTFTALALLKVCEDKKIDIQQPIGNYVKNLSPKQSAITFHQLLSHTSGIVDEWEQTKEKSLSKYFADMGDNGFFETPGSVFSYSNNGYALAGLLLEKLTGTSYTIAIDSIIIKPLQLNNTLFGYAEVQKRNYVTGYQNNISVDPVLQEAKDMPAGGLFSTTNDLIKFAQIFYSNNTNTHPFKLVTQKMFGNYIYDGTMPEYLGYADAYYGYGLINFSYKGVQFSGHPGEGESQNATCVIAPKHNGCIIILSNAGFYPFRNSFEKAIELFFPTPKTAVVANEPKAIRSFELKDLVGKYIDPKVKTGTGNVMEVKQEGNNLLLIMNETEKISLEKTGLNKFILKADLAKFPIEIGFYENKKTKKVKYLVFYGRVLLKE